MKNELLKYDNTQLKKIKNVIAITDKLLRQHNNEKEIRLKETAFLIVKKLVMKARHKSEEENNNSKINTVFETDKVTLSGDDKKFAERLNHTIAENIIKNEGRNIDEYKHLFFGDLH